MLDWPSFLTPSVPLLELVVRGTITFLALMLLLRLTGQRESGGLGLTDLLLVVLVADAASTGLTGDAETIGDGLILVCTIIVWSVCLDAVSYRWPWLARVLKSRPKPLIENGMLNRRAMRREFLTRGEVMSQLRLQGIDDLSGVRRAFIEPNGMISVIPVDDGTPEDQRESDAP